VNAGGPSRRYCLDADALINMYLFYPGALGLLTKASKAGRIVLVEGVFREIRRHTDELWKRALQWDEKHGAVIRIHDHRVKEEISRVDRKYGPDFSIGGRTRKGFWKSKSGSRAADAQVVAYSKYKGLIIVSNDQAINDAALLENVPCITWQEFYRRLSIDEL
jgi:hypothetical protein